jgi:exonuclease VII small subunit
MREPMWKSEDSKGTQPVPCWTTYAEAMNQFNRSARAFMEQVHLLTEARTAYQEAMAVGTELRNRLDAGERTLRDLMTQLEQVVSAHLGDPPLDGKKPEPVRGENTRPNSQATGTWRLP